MIEKAASKIIGRAISRNISCSPYKLRPLTDVIREKNVLFALNWLQAVYVNQKAFLLRKVIYSAVANMLQKQGVSIKSVSAETLKDIKFVNLKVDQGAIRKYFRPGPQGKATILRTRYSHITVEVEAKSEKSNENKKNSFLVDNKGV
jgi:ribosomal protein L22